MRVESCELKKITRRILYFLILTSYILLFTSYISFHPLWAQEQALSDINLEWLKKKEQALKWGRDPFVLPTSQAGRGGKEAIESEFRLSAIIYRAGRGVAIINNRIVRIGDAIEGMKVAEIRQDRVILRDRSGNQELRIKRLGPVR